MFSLADCKKRFEIIKNNFSLQDCQHIKIGDKETIVYGKEKNLIYIPSNTGYDFKSSNNFVNLVIGPYGSGKTTMCLHRIVEEACKMPAWHNGRRRSRTAIFRNTTGELYSTTLKSWLNWFSELGNINKRQKPLLTYEHTFNDGKGLVELEIIFIALDREDEIRKIKSLELTNAYINELSEVPEGLLSHLKGRLNGRYPSSSFCKEGYWSGIIADTNPPDNEHWIYRDFELNKVSSYKIFHQPPGLLKENGIWIDNKEADNAKNLTREDHNKKIVFDYYSKLAEGQSEDFIKVYCLGQYGTVKTGKVVYPEFNLDLHAVDDIEVIENEQIYLGWDFGLTPACLVVQMSQRGQFRVIKEFQAQDMGIRTFAQSVVLPQLNRLFPTNPIGQSVADPSGMSKDTIMEELSCIGELNSIGISTIPASTNDIGPRIGAVKYFLNTMLDGKPSFCVSRKGCSGLIKGLAKDYVYKKLSVSGEERYKEAPDKNMSSHLQDTLQYVALFLAPQQIVKLKEPLNKVNVFNQTMGIF